MFLDILEFTVENKKKGLGKTALKVKSLKVHKTTFKKNVKTIKNKQKKTKKNNENVYNLWRILGTKLLLLVDF